MICGPGHLTRRNALQLLGLSGLPWLTRAANLLAREVEAQPQSRAKSLIVLWMSGGPSQLDTFDPHPGTKIGGDVQAIPTAAEGVRIAAGFERLADRMDKVCLIRSVVSKEGDHERATYAMHTGYRPDPTLVHPAIGAILCHELPSAGCEVPRHVSIAPGPFPPRGGFLGDKYDAFKTFDALGRMPDTDRGVAEERFRRRLADLDVVEEAFARGRVRDLDERKTLHRATIEQAVQMMTSEQRKAFDVSEVPLERRLRYGDTTFGRGCLAAFQLIQVGVRCVEISLGTWDSHVNNHQTQANRVAELDPAFSALLDDLSEADLLDDTIVLCCGEFGRTPTINPAEGRDHWPHGYSVAVAGGGFRGGHLHGATDPQGGKKVDDPLELGDLFATLLQQLGVRHAKHYDTPIGRPMRASDGEPVASLVLS